MSIAWTLVWITTQLVGSRAQICSLNCTVQGWEIYCNSGIQEKHHMDGCGKLTNESVPTLVDPSIYVMFHLTGYRVSETGASVFARFPNLNQIHINNNIISRLHPHTFQGLDNIVHLTITSSGLDKLPQNLLDGLPGLEILDLSGNSLPEIPSRTFQKLGNLTQLYIQSNRISTIHDDSFEGLSNLRALYMDDNRLTILPDFALSPLSRLKGLMLARNRLSRIPDLSKCCNLSHLVLSHNRISRVPEFAFPESPTGEMEEILLDNNMIVDIDYLAFSGLRSIGDLKLAHNLLIDFPHIQLQLLKEITNLDLSHNLMTRVPPYALQRVRVSSVILSDNSICDIDFHAFDDIHRSSTVSVNMKNNSVEYLAVPMFSNPIEILSRFRVDFGNNPLRCNCNMRPFYYWYKYKVDLNGFDTMQCTEPAGVAGLLLKDLPSNSSLVCTRPRPVMHVPLIWGYEGEPIVLPCAVFAEPRPTIRWTQPNGHHSRTMSGGIRVKDDGSLTIDRTKRTQAGVWHCEASNPEGTITLEVEVRIIRERTSALILFISSVSLAIIGVLLICMSAAVCIKQKQAMPSSTSTTDQFEVTNHASNGVKSQSATGNNQPVMEAVVEIPILSRSCDLETPEFLVGNRTDHNSNDA